MNSQTPIIFFVSVLNEEMRIEGLLRSIDPYASCIVVFDSGCEDSTVERAKQFRKVRVIVPTCSVFEPRNRFQRIMLDLSKEFPGYWAFPVSCSELLPTSLGDKIHQLVCSGGDNYDAINCYRQSYTWGVPTHRRKLVYLIEILLRKSNIRVFKPDSVNWDASRIHRDFPLKDEAKIMNLWPTNRLSLIHNREGFIEDFEEKHTAYSSREAYERVMGGDSGSLARLVTRPLFSFLYFLPAALLDRRALVVAIYHAFYKFQVEAKVLLWRHTRDSVK